jgi:uncharacterized protein YbaP (TraB family)
MPAVRRGLAAIAAALICAIPVASFALPAMWTVHGSRGRAVLFGSVHMLPPGLEWEPPALAEALARADEIWFELPIDAATNGEAQALVLRKGALPKGANLFDRLDPKDAERLRAACIDVGVPPELVGTMRPWLAEVTLSLAQDVRAGAKPGDGVEQRVSELAGQRVKRRAFETAEQQIDYLAAAPTADQAASLRETLAEISDDPDIYNRVVKAWLAGDLAALQKDALEPLAKASPPMYRRLISARNHRWAVTLDQRLKGEGQIVVVVGAGHLVGPDGLPSLLRARGLTVDGPSEATAAPH